MKNMIKNDEAVSVVVGAILILAVLVTFMSVVTSSWVPIYEGNAESDHSDTTHRTFMDLHKQIELADESSNSATIDLGTDDISFIKNSYSVGYLEVNESSGGLFLTGNISRTDIPSTTAVGIGMDVEDLNTSSSHPLNVFKFEFTQLDPQANNKLDDDFIVQFRTSTLDRWITLYSSDIGAPDKNLGIIVKYDNSNVKWENTGFGVSDNPGPSDPEIFIDHVDDDDILKVNLLSNNTTLELMEGVNQTLNDGTEYSIGSSAKLHDVIQYCMGLYGGGSDYYIDYVQYNGVLDSIQYFEINDSSTSSTPTTGSDNIAKFNNTPIGGGTLTLRSDYNFMVDQSYVYDSGAVFLSQEDGSVLKVNPPIVTSNNSGNLSLSINSVILKGDYQASGNGVETLYTTLSGITTVSGFTDNITIVKETTPEYYGFWKSFFDDLNLSASSFATITTTPLYNETNSRLELMIVDNTNPSITVSLKTKEIDVT